MVFRVYVEKKKGLDHEAQSLKNELRTMLDITALEDLRVLNRYDVQNIDSALFEYCKTTVFSEPQQDSVCDAPDISGSQAFAVEYLPGQFDQRADSASQCIQIISQGDRPSVRTARVFLLYGSLTAGDIDKIKHYVINPVEARETSLDTVDTLEMACQIPTSVETLSGFHTFNPEKLRQFAASQGLAMDLADLEFCREYFISEDRDPTITEIKLIDTYWSDHCRHTTFNTTIDNIRFEDSAVQKAYDDYLAARRAIGRTAPVTLMDMGTIAVRSLKKAGKLKKLDDSEEINACTVTMTVDVDGKDEDWLLLFKNETHNHPTEIEPFGGAATCIGGAIRDPLSGRSYVYAAMRVTGAADPTRPVSETLPGKLPQRKIVTGAAAGYSSYGNQIGLATGQVDEIYHPGYAAKHMEIGAVIGAAPRENVVRLRPEAGDLVILLGGRTGRDGCGGATGSSKSHTLDSLESCGAEVQKGNAPEERKLQRLFRNPEASKLIIRCNDFGAGGVSVAIGELADGLDIDLNAVPKKYEGLDGTELAISESQERMAVVVRPADEARFLNLADSENIEATIVARVKAEPRLTMVWNGNTIVDISRAFLDTNGAEKHADALVAPAKDFSKAIGGDFSAQFETLAADLNACTRKGLSERFDSTIGAGTVLMPFGGIFQLTPIQAMVHKISLEKGETSTCSAMAWGYNPFITERSPYHGAYLAVVESVSKLIACGAPFDDIYLTFQEYFEKLASDPGRWGKPAAALLGAFKAQMGLGVAAIGGKDSMSGTFENLDVPPTLVSFAVTTCKTDNVVSPEFKAPGHRVALIRPDLDNSGLPEPESLKKVYKTVHGLLSSKKALAAYTPTFGGVAEAVMKMAFGNGVGIDFAPSLSMADIFGYSYGAFVVELAGAEDMGITLGVTTGNSAISYKGASLPLDRLLGIFEERLESVYPTTAKTPLADIPAFSYNGKTKQAPAVKTARPKVLIPVFPGTNCEYDTARAMALAGGDARIIVINNLTSDGIARSVEQFSDELKSAQIVLIPGGFSGGDEPDGSGKFITAFFRSAAVKEQVTTLLKRRDGLMCGICNGFQALIKLGLVPFGEIIDADENCPTLTFNAIGRHQSRLVRTRIASNKSPWLANTQPGDLFTVPISHGEGRFVASSDLIARLSENGQIATQYVDLNGNPTNDIRFNPNGSAFAVEGITSPDGRVLGKMGHSERIGSGLYKNVPGQYDMGMFESAVKYFR